MEIENNFFLRKTKMKIWYNFKIQKFILLEMVGCRTTSVGLDDQSIGREYI